MGFLYAKLPDYVKVKLPELKDEPWRVGKVPFDVLLANLGAEGYDDVEDMNVEDRDRPFWEFVDEDFLLRAGCDASTADRLFMKCRAFAAGRTPDTYPPEKLVAEFENAMTSSYTAIDNFSEELRHWLYEKIVDCENVNKRQK